MNTKLSLIICAAAAIGVTGCKKETTTSAEIERAADRAERSVERAADRAEAQVDKTKEYLRDTRDDFYAATDRRVAELDRQIDAYEKRARDYTAETRTDADRAVKALREKRNRLKEKYGELKGDSSDAWSDLKAGFNKAVDELEEAIKEAKAKFD